MRRSPIPVIALIAAAAALAGCSSTSTGGSAAASSAPAMSSAPAASTAATAPSASAASTAASASAVPDACSLLTNDEITAITGKDPGAGTPNAVDPSLRTVCRYPNGLILAVEVAADYDESVTLISTDPNVKDAQDVTGVGEKGLYTSYGQGVAQVVALQGPYFVGVTGLVDRDQASRLAQAMLDAL